MKLTRIMASAAISICIPFAPAFTGNGHAGTAEGKKAFDSKKCGGCHQQTGPAKEKTIADQLAKKGPELWYAGSKLQKPFLQKWLRDPKPIRPMEFYSLTKKNAGNHPRLDGKNADDVADYLMSLTSPDVKNLGLQPKSGAMAKLVIGKKYGCYGCHGNKQGSEVGGGVTGPSFVGAGERLQADWIYAYLSNPKVFKPVKDMPVYVGLAPDGDMRTLAELISSFK
jgi:mono/diheme cytochrome c family protein